MLKRGDVLVIPTPALAEMLTRADAVGNDWLATLHGKKAIRIAPFDEMAAIECAALAARRKEPESKHQRVPKQSLMSRL